MSVHEDSLIIVIGRGHSGTRLLSQTLYASGVYMGERLNESADKVPTDELHAAARILAGHVGWSDGLAWDFGELNSMAIDADFTRHLESYLADVLPSRRAQRGWKLPETTLTYPWLVRMFPNARYVFLVRDPKDGLLGKHPTDNLDRFNIPHPETSELLERRVVSWKYQYDIVKATPEPANFITIRFEDLVLDQESTLERLEDFLGIPLARAVVDKTRVGRWKSSPEILDHLRPLERAMREHGYDLPRGVAATA